MGSNAVVRAVWKPETGLFLAFWLVFLTGLRSQPFNDPGALWHVRVGDLILDNGAFPHTDPFTYTFAGHFWIPQQWGAECLMALAHRQSGFDGVLLLMSTVLAAFAAWVAGRFVRGGLHWSLAFVLTGLGLAVAAFHFYARPHLATIVLMGWTMARLVDYERGRIGLGGLVWLVPVYVLWTNLHGGVLGGVMTFGLAVAGWAGLFVLRGALPAGARLNEEAEPLTPVRSWRTAFFLGLLVLACGLTPFDNPFGLGMLRTWFSIVGSKVLPMYVSEHQPLDLTHTGGQAVVGFAVFYLIALAGIGRRWPRVTWLLPLAWFVLATKGIRHGPLFCATALVAMADFLPHTVWFRLLQKYGDTLVRPPLEGDKETAPAGFVSLSGWLIPALVVFGAFELQVNRVAVPVVGAGWAKLDPKGIPVELIEEVRQYAAAKPDGQPIFNDANLGGFLIYHAPRLRIFMDDRCELYGDPWMAEYVEMATDHPERVEDWAKRFAFDRAMVVVDTPMDEYLSRSNRWRVVAKAKYANLYERTGE